jgi:uncharacterized tellurite resistance protein B-like protein
VNATRELINILIHLAEADKHFARAERDLIIRIAEERHLPGEQVANLIRQPDPISTPEKMTIEERYDYLYLTIELIFADRHIFQSEIDFCKKIAPKLGFGAEAIDFFVEHYGTMPSTGLKANVLENFTKSGFGG